MFVKAIADLGVFLVLAASAAAQEKPQAKPEAPAAGAPRQANAQPAGAVSVQGVQIGGLWYLSYQARERCPGATDETQTCSQFRVKRGYLNFRARPRPWLEVRFTPDVSQDSAGDLKLLAKYLYAGFTGKGNSVIGRPYVEFGLVHMPWLDFEEHLNRFRMQDTMFLERNGLFNSADFGILAGGNFGTELGEDFRRDVNGAYAGRYGSWQVALMNGGGYRARENNGNKVLQARATARPFPDPLPGLQFSLFGVRGKGNLPQAESSRDLPDYDVLAGMVSYEHELLVLSAQWYSGEGNAAGTAVGPDGRSARRQSGSSYFAELRFTGKRNLSAIGRYDRFDADRRDPAVGLQQRLIAGVAWRMFGGNYILFDYDRVWRGKPRLRAPGRLQATLQIAF